MDISWWHWLILGFVLIAVEIAAPIFFIIWFGLGAICVGLILLLAPAIGLTLQVGLWGVLSLFFTLLWFGVFRQKNLITQDGTAQGGVAGEVGLLISDVTPFERGQVRFQRPVLGTDTWPCVADEPISAGARVQILAVEGNWVRIGPVTHKAN